MVIVKWKFHSNSFVSFLVHRRATAFRNKYQPIVSWAVVPNSQMDGKKRVAIHHPSKLKHAQLENAVSRIATYLERHWRSCRNAGKLSKKSRWEQLFLTLACQQPFTQPPTSKPNSRETQSITASPKTARTCQKYSSKQNHGSVSVT